MRRRKKVVDYILPFLIFISVGIIGVLGFQLWVNFGNADKVDASFYIIEGDAKILPFSHSVWDKAVSGSKFLVGDSIKSSYLGRVVVKFFNNSVIRMAGDTAISLVDLNNRFGKEIIAVRLDNGKIWFKGTKEVGMSEALYTVRTSHLLVKAHGTAFEVESLDNKEIVRVFDGIVKVDIYVSAPSGERIANTVSVGVGEEIVVDQSILQSFKNNLSPSVLMSVGDDFKSTDWYKWNVKEDAHATDFSVIDVKNDVGDDENVVDIKATDNVVSDVDVDSDIVDGEVGTDIVESNDDDSGESNDVVESLENPKVLSFNGKTSNKVDVDYVKVVGSVKGATEVYVDGYKLSKFKPGDDTWVYYASVGIGNLKEGINDYEVYAVGKDGEKSDVVSFSIDYEKNSEDGADGQSVDENVNEDVVNGDDKEVDVDEKSEDVVEGNGKEVDDSQKSEDVVGDEGSGVGDKVDDGGGDVVSEDKSDDDVKDVVSGNKDDSGDDNVVDDKKDESQNDDLKENDVEKKNDGSSDSNDENVKSSDSKTDRSDEIQYRF